MTKEELLANPEKLVGTCWKGSSYYFKVLEVRSRVVIVRGFAIDADDCFSFLWDNETSSDIQYIQNNDLPCPESEWNEALDKTLARIKEVLKYEI